MISGFTILEDHFLFTMNAFLDVTMYYIKINLLKYQYFCYTEYRFGAVHVIRARFGSLSGSRDEARYGQLLRSADGWTLPRWRFGGKFLS